MRDSIKEIYSALDTEPPEKLQDGTAIWTVMDSSSHSGQIRCANPATESTSDVIISEDKVPDDLIDEKLFTDSGNINPELKMTPVRVVIPAEGGLEDAWIQKAVEEVSELKPKSVYEKHKRSDAIEWDGTAQKQTDENVERRNGIFSEADERGSKNDLINGGC